MSSRVRLGFLSLMTISLGSVNRSEAGQRGAGGAAVQPAVTLDCTGADAMKPRCLYERAHALHLQGKHDLARDALRRAREEQNGVAGAAPATFLLLREAEEERELDHPDEVRRLCDEFEQKVPTPSPAQVTELSELRRWLERPRPPLVVPVSVASTVLPRWRTVGGKTAIAAGALTLGVGITVGLLARSDQCFFYSSPPCPGQLRWDSEHAAGWGFGLGAAGVAVGIAGVLSLALPGRKVPARLLARREETP